jgi:Arc/MetJ-type ribon-helix-helix transcriptional regulator
MKVSVSLPDEDVAYIDEYARRKGTASRSAVLHRAVNLLRLNELEDGYADAWDEWNKSDDGAMWDQTSSDGLGDAAR